MNKKEAICFLVSNEARDFYLLIPIIYHLEKYHGFSVKFEFVWNGHKIRKIQPDLVILPNTRGHNLYFEIAQYCVENEILVMHHDSEGNFNINIVYDFWGYNKNQELLSPVQFTWNEKVKKYLENNYPQLRDKTFVTGAPGFDKYAYLSRKSKQEVLKKYNLEHFDKVVGYAGWAFGKLYNKELLDVLKVLEKAEDSGVLWMEEQRDIVEECLRIVIEKYPDTLFILKKHPRENFESDYRDSRNEMNRLVGYPNVLYLKDQEEIQDLIGISDLWMAFESTSIMEAWLLGVPTLMINPDADFNRVNIHKGSYTVKNPEEMIEGFEQFQSGNETLFFQKDILNARSEIISGSIGYSDGLNHVRSVRYFKEYLNSIKTTKKPAVNYRFLRLFYLLNCGKYFYIPWLFKRLPKLKKTVWVFENEKLDKVLNAIPAIYSDLDQFYAKNGLDKSIESGEIWNKLG